MKKACYLDISITDGYTAVLKCISTPRPTLHHPSLCSGQKYQQTDQDKILHLKIKGIQNCCKTVLKQQTFLFNMYIFIFEDGEGRGYNILFSSI